MLVNVHSQTPLTEAENFHVKTIYGEPIWLFPILDDDNKIVVIDFFSTTCGPCQDYADDFQACYENFGYNEGNVYFMGINWGNDNQGVYEFDSIFGLTFPSASGTQGGGNIVYQNYEILSYPTVIVITPDHNIVEQYVWYPDEETITNAVIAAGGILVGTDESYKLSDEVNVFPNPISDNGTIEFYFDYETIAYHEIIDMLGNVVQRSTSTSYKKGKNRIVFSVNDINSGIYIIRVIADNSVFSKSMISVIH